MFGILARYLLSLGLSFIDYIGDSVGLLGKYRFCRIEFNLGGNLHAALLHNKIPKYGND